MAHERLLNSGLARALTDLLADLAGNVGAHGGDQSGGTTHLPREPLVVATGLSYAQQADLFSLEDRLQQTRATGVPGRPGH